ncbi:glycosyl transferase [Sphingomonadales bacterium EhC05]|nr:glycosyl transferase [Sphingomonadales bacterium EhC05]
MKTVLFSINYTPDMTGTGYYSGVMATELLRRGHGLTVFAAPPFYPEWKLRKGYRNWRWSREVIDGVTVYRCPTFIPRRPSGMTRLLHYGSFAFTALLASIWWRLFHRPDIIFNITPTLFSAIPALFLTKISKAKSWLHIQDFEVEAGFATGQMRGDGSVAKLAMAFEHRMINRFDFTSSISMEMCNKLVEKGRDEKTVYELRNWSDVDAVFPMTHSAFRSDWNINSQHVALYSGSITRKQGIEVVIDAARLMQDRNDLIFILCGSGPTRAELEESCADLKNIQFHDLQPYEKLGELLALATVHLLPQKADAANLVLPSKLANMLASGRPVVVGADPATGLAREVNKCGIVFEPENAEALTQAIAQIIDSPAASAKFSKNARERAVRYWRRDPIIDALDVEMKALVNES